MMKKATRAYKVGFTDGVNGKHHNTYVKGSTRHADYERGYRDGDAS